MFITVLKPQKTVRMIEKESAISVSVSEGGGGECANVDVGEDSACVIVTVGVSLSEGLIERVCVREGGGTSVASCGAK